MQAPISAVEILKSVESDLASLRQAKANAHRRSRRDHSPAPSPADDLRQAGVDEGLLLALQAINRRLAIQNSAQNKDMSAKFLKARQQLQSAELAYSLADYGAAAPLASAAYSAYVQAYKALEQARAHYLSVVRAERLSSRETSAPL